jgi:hypothetical protein
MPEPSDTPIALQTWHYGLPRDTDAGALAAAARLLARNLEELGCFDQRAPEPAHAFCLEEADER